MRRIAKALGRELSTVHEEDESVLLLDRAPLSWRHGDERGLAWSEGIPHRSRVMSWREAAQRLAACGLVVGRGRSYLHSSVAGIAPIYYRDDGEATYFASRIDPLVRACREKLSIDWEAWAAILITRSPLGDRTPFLEVRRLPPFSVLEHRRSQGARQTVHEWPWAQPDRELGEDGAEAIVDELRRVVGSLPAGPVACPLSGGWDSRLLLSLLCERDDLEISALTLARIQEGYAELEYARPVASALGVPLTEIAPGQGRFWEEAAEVALRTDFQTSHHGWYMPLARELGRQPGPAVDGLVGDTLIKGGIVVSEAMAAAPSWEQATALQWDRITNARDAGMIISDRLAAAFTTLAWRQWQADARLVADHPAFLLLTAYLNRAVRGVSLAPASVLGAETRTVTPFTDNRVARAALAVPLSMKIDKRLYRRVFEIVNPYVGSLTSTADPPPDERRAEAEPEAPSVIEGYRRRIEQSPLRGETNNELFEGGARLAKSLKSAKRFHVVQALAIFAMWHERYRKQLREVDVRDIVG